MYFHYELMRIHPFVDGNGRIKRITKNWVLMYNLYPPIFIKDEVEKKECITSLGNNLNVIARNGNVWHQETNTFFEQELTQAKDSIYTRENKIWRERVV